jgi:hypothetical protein
VEATSHRWRAPVAVALVVALTLTTIWYAVLRTPHGSARGSGGLHPATLHLRADADGNAPMAMAAAGSSTVTGTVGGRPGADQASAADGYVLDADLPTGPATARVYRLRAPTDAQVRSLAEAFGLSDVRHSSGRWTATTGDRQLTVQDGPGGNWSYTPSGTCGPTGGCAAGSAGGSGTAASVGSKGSVTSGTAVPPDLLPTITPVEPPVAEQPPLADDATLRRAAGPILAALGLTTAGAHITTAYGQITVNPSVDGLPTVGMQLSLSAAADGTIQFANGWLGSVVEGDEYPVIGAASAFAGLRAQPRPMIMSCLRPGPAAAPTPASTARAGTASAGPASPGPASPGPRTDPATAGDMPCQQPSIRRLAVTGARFGESLQWLDEGPALVPSWLFTVDENTAWPQAVLAVDPIYLPQPAAPAGKGIGEPAAPNGPCAITTPSGPVSCPETAP